MVTGLSPDCSPKGEQFLNPNVNGQLLIDGQNFVATSIVRWNGSDRPTTFYDSTQITAQIPMTDITAIGTATVTVFTPAPGGGSSNAMTFTINPGGVGPRSIAVDPVGNFAYVANEGCGGSTFGNLSVYAIDASSGTLASVGPPVPSHDEGARSVAVDPSGKFVYVANWGEGDTNGSIAAYTIDAGTGALTSTQTLWQGVLAPWSVVVHPSGKFAYVANEGGFAPTVVTEHTIDATGKLASTLSIVSGGRAVAVTVDPTGKFAYVANESEPPGSAGSVSIYTIDPSKGTLTSVGLVAAGTDPTSVALHPSGKFAYVTNSSSNDVSIYTIDANSGTLTPKGTIAAGGGPSSIAIDPPGEVAYVANFGSNDVSIYTIDANSGTLTPKGTIAAGVGPSSIAIDPPGEFAYVANFGSNDVSIYSIDAVTGALTLVGSIGT
jgi:YVTN family beta-propeller protein